MHEQQMLVLMVPSELRDDVVDALIASDQVNGFNMSAIAGFSREHSQYDLREQVEGHRQLFRFEVVHPCQQQQALLAVLRPVCETAHIRYWFLPVLDQGHL